MAGFLCRIRKTENTGFMNLLWEHFPSFFKTLFILLFFVCFDFRGVCVCVCIILKDGGYKSGWVER